MLIKDFNRYLFLAYFNFFCLPFTESLVKGPTHPPTSLVNQAKILLTDREQNWRAGYFLTTGFSAGLIDKTRSGVLPNSYFTIPSL